MAQPKELIKIEPIKKKLIQVRIVGDSPLITHNWDVKAQREILEKEMGIKKVQKMKKNPYEDFASSAYWLEKMPDPVTKESLDEAIANGARFGFPLTGVKQAAISAAYRMGWSKDKMSLRGAFFIEPEVDGYWSGDRGFRSSTQSCLACQATCIRWQVLGRGRRRQNTAVGFAFR